MNLNTIIGQVVFGFASDRISVYIPLVISSICTAVAVCTLWLLGTNMVGFAVVYGLFVGGLNVIYARFATMLSDKDANAALWVYWLLAFDRGLGYIVSVPISGSIGGGNTIQEGSKSAYRCLISFDGMLFVLSACGWMGWFFTRRQRRPATQNPV